MGVSNLIEPDFHPIEPAARARKIIAAIDAATANRPSIRYQPGYTGTDPLIFTSWAAVVAAIAASPNPVTVYYDPTGLVGTTHILPAAGVYDLKHSTIERFALGGAPGPVGAISLEIPAGSQLRNLGAVVGDLVIRGNATALVPSLAFDPPAAPETTPEAELVLSDGAICTNLGASPMIVGTPAVQLRLSIVRSRGWVTGAAGVFISLTGASTLIVEADRWQMPNSSAADFLLTSATASVAFVDDGTVPGPIRTRFTQINALATVAQTLWGSGGSSSAVAPNVRPTAGRPGIMTIDAQLNRPLFWNGTTWMGPDPVIGTARDFHINAATGNNNNDGSAGAPLASVAGLQQLIGVQPNVTSGVNVYYHGAAVPEAIDLHIDIAPTGLFRLIFDATLLQAGQVTNVVARNNATRTSLDITDAATPINWALLVGKRVRITTVGARFGAIAWVVKDLGANTARVTPFAVYDPTTATSFVTLVTPIVGDTFEIEDLADVTGVFNLEVGGPAVLVAGLGKAFVENASFNNAQPSSLSSNAAVRALNCAVTGAGALQFRGTSGTIWAINCFARTGSGGISGPGSALLLDAGGSMVDVSAAQRSLVLLRDGFTVQGAKLVARQGGGLQIFDANVWDWPVQICSVSTMGRVELANAAALSGSSAAAGSYLFDVVAGYVGAPAGVTWLAAVPAQGAGASDANHIAKQTSGQAYDTAGPAIVAGARNYTMTLLDATIAGGGFAGNASSQFALAAMSQQ